MGFCSSNVFSLLDIDAKAYIIEADFDAFVANFNDYNIEPHVLCSLKEKINKYKYLIFRFKESLFNTFRGESIVAGCFEYMELMEKPEVFDLCEILQLFEFEIDCNSNSISSTNQD